MKVLSGLNHGLDFVMISIAGGVDSLDKWIFGKLYALAQMWHGCYHQTSSQSIELILEVHSILVQTNFPKSNAPSNGS